MNAHERDLYWRAYLAALEGRSSDPGMTPVDADAVAAESAALALARYRAQNPVAPRKAVGK